MKKTKKILLFIMVLISINSITATSMSRASLPNSYGDSYANDFLEEFSVYCVNGNNAENAPDNISAEIFYDYSNGILTLDMGLNEEILNGVGDDFVVIAGDGEYYVKVKNSEIKPPVYIAEGSEVKDSIIGPYAMIETEVEITNSEITDSVILEKSKLIDSVI